MDSFLKFSVRIPICISCRHFAEVYDHGDACLKHLNDFCGCTTYRNGLKLFRMKPNTKHCKQFICTKKKVLALVAYGQGRSFRVGLSSLKGSCCGGLVCSLHLITFWANLTMAAITCARVVGSCHACHSKNQLWYEHVTGVLVFNWTWRWWLPSYIRGFIPAAASFRL